MHRGAYATLDDDLLRRLHAPPPLADAVESLAYWRERRTHLPWYKRAARREAEQMIRRSEHRVLAAVVSPDDTPLRVRAGAAALVLRTRAGHWGRRIRLGAVKATAACGACIVAVIAVLDAI